MGDLGMDFNIGLIVIFGAVGYGIYKVLNPTKPPPGSQTASSGTNLTPDQAASEAKNQADPPNYGSTQYATWAAAIQNEGNRFIASSGTQTLSIFDQMDNVADVLSLIAAFGNYRPTDLGIPDTNTYNLATWLYAGFTSDAIAAINQQLTWNGVNYSF